MPSNFNVAIVGRPNVGKSTLFNRIVRKRIAITLKESGTTRDRISAETEWNKTKFILTDTGGYITDKHGEVTEFTQQVNFQIEQAIKSADVIIFLADGSVPPTAQDFVINEMLRKSKRPFFLALNKIDKKDTANYQHEYYQFGVKEIFPISAEHGIGVDVLSDAVVMQIRNTKSEILKTDDKPFLQTMIIGRPNVGKSLFLNKLLNEERVIVSETPGTTRDSIQVEFTFDDKKVSIIDTAGLRKKAQVKESVEYFSVQRVVQHIPLVNVVILLIDPTTTTRQLSPLSNQDRHIIQLILNYGKGVVISINKSDLITNTERNNVLNETKFSLRNYDFIPVVMMSALKNKGLIETIKKAQDVFESGSKKVTEDVLAETVAPRLLGNPPSNRIKYLYVKQSGILPPKFDIITNVTKDIKETYERYIIKEIRNYFGFAGNPIRLIIKSK
jgi:GTP-binding protein